MKVEFDPTKYNEILNKIQSLGSRIDNMKPVWEKFENFYKNEQTKKFFDSKGKILGSKWQNLSPAYEKWKKKNYPGRPLLVLTGKMKEATMGGAGWFSNKTKNKMSFGIRGEAYYPVHQYGSLKKKIPQRPFLFGANKELPARAITKLMNLMRIYIKGDWE